MTFGSLFAGIGGFDLGLERAGMVCKWQVEKDQFCRRVLAKHWPDVKRYEDIKDVTETETVDLICGGFPCQPFSVAGKQRGTEDDRYLWPEMFRIIKTVRPTWVIGENVVGIIRMAIPEVLSDLESAGYNCQSFIIPACAKDAPHRRERVWIVAHTEKPGLERENTEGDTCTDGRTAELCGEKQWRWPTESGICRISDGIPGRVDRIRALGNAVVPQVVEIIGRSILAACKT